MPSLTIKIIIDRVPLEGTPRIFAPRRVLGALSRNLGTGTAQYRCASLRYAHKDTRTDHIMLTFRDIVGYRPGQAARLLRQLQGKTNSRPSPKPSQTLFPGGDVRLLTSLPGTLFTSLPGTLHTGLPATLHTGLPGEPLTRAPQTFNSPAPPTDTLPIPAPPQPLLPEHPAPPTLNSTETRTMIDNPSPANLSHSAPLAPLHETVAPLLESAEPEPFTPPPTAVPAPSPLPRSSKRRRPKPRDNNLHRAARQANLHPAPRQTPGVSLTHHQPLCTICNHPDRDAIDEAFLHWERPSAIAHHFQLNDRRILYRHAHALDLFRKRAARSRRALEFIMEQAETVTATADSVIRAVKAHACLDEDGHWHEPVKRLIITHRYVDSAPDSEALGTGLAASFSPLPARRSPLRSASAAGKVSGRSRRRSRCGILQNISTHVPRKKPS